MKLKKGSKAPLFKVPSTGDREFNLEDRRGKLTILYFYPKDFTYGCTKEACSFRDEFESFKNLGIEVFGINKDSISTHNKFRKELNLPFHLLSDQNSEVAKKYNAILPVIGMIKRVTFLIDEELKVLESFDSLTRFDQHVKQILALKKMKANSFY